jgi:hypothetical protein
MADPIFQANSDTVDRNLCFVLMPFSEPFSDEAYLGIKEVVADYAGLECLRADELATPSKITDDVWTHIQRARFCVADLTTSNPNVFYEVGLCHALNKPVILLLQKGDKKPFDIRHIRYLEYSAEDIPNLRRQLIRAVKTQLNSIPKTWNKSPASDGPSLRITGVEAPSSAFTGEPIMISVKAKNFGPDAPQGYFSVSFPSGPSVAILESDVRTKIGQKRGRWKSGQVVLDYPIAEALIYVPPDSTGPLWRRGDTHYMTVQVAPARRGLFQFYVSASVKMSTGPFVNDPTSSAFLDQRDEPVYSGVIEVKDKVSAAFRTD